MIEFLNAVAKERPVGSKNNEELLALLQKEMLSMGYDISSLPFSCAHWDKGRSYIETAKKQYEVFPSPFSKPYQGYSEVSAVNSLNELETVNINDRVVFLMGELARWPLMPKNYPFYYPEEHRHLIELLEEKKPKAVVAVTGKHPMAGLNPFPMFEDGNFTIPSAYTDKLTAIEISQNDSVNICINSKTSIESSKQLVASKKSTDQTGGKIIICAHMDTKYETPGALDNAAGLAVMLEVMEALKFYGSFCDIDFVPFNSEEYYEASGELKYMDYIENDTEPVKLVINIDSPCHVGSETAVSTYNFGDELDFILKNELAKSENTVLGEGWYSGDHAAFAFKGIPCIAVTSSDLFESVIELTHTQADIKELISSNLVAETAKFLTGFIKAIDSGLIHRANPAVPPASR